MWWWLSDKTVAVGKPVAAVTVVKQGQLHGRRGTAAAWHSGGIGGGVGATVVGVGLAMVQSDGDVVELHSVRTK